MSNTKKDLSCFIVDTAFTTGHNVLKPEYLRRKSREDIIRAIRTGVVDDINVKNIVGRIRTAEDKAARKALKLKLPWLSGGLFYLRRSLSELIQNNYIILDVDDLADSESAKEQLHQVDPSLDFAFRSPSGGMKLVYRLETPVEDNISYTRAYCYLAEDLLRNLSLEADEGAKSRAQACFFSYDPQIFVSDNCIPLCIESLAVSQTPSHSRYSECTTLSPHYNSYQNCYHSSTDPFYSYHDDYHTATAVISYLSQCGKISYDDWLRTAYALKAKFGEAGKEIFAIYANNAAYNDDYQSLYSYWDRLGAPKSISFPSLIWVARKYGWSL